MLPDLTCPVGDKLSHLNHPVTSLRAIYVEAMLIWYYSQLILFIMEVITKSNGNLKVITGGYAYNDKSVYASGDLRLRCSQKNFDALLSTSIVSMWTEPSNQWILRRRLTQPKIPFVLFVSVEYLPDTPQLCGMSTMQQLKDETGQTTSVNHSMLRSSTWLVVPTHLCGQC